MANYIIDGTLLTNIAAAIRSKKGVSTTYTPAEMATAINGLTVGATEVTALTASYAQGQKKVPRQVTVNIDLDNPIDSIKEVSISTFNGVPIASVTLTSSSRIVVRGNSSSDAYLSSIAVIGYTHSIQ